MNTKSPTLSIKSREIIGVDAFSQRREVFDKHDTVFLPLPSPTNMVSVHQDFDPIVTSNHGKTTTNFKRNTTGYSSFRESKTDEGNYDFRPRKYSDNFTSELNQSDDVDYRYSAMERNRRLSKMRRDFLNSNLHEPDDKPFTRAGTRASLPVGKSTPMRYKIESPNLYKFPFAEPYSTPPPVRRVIVDLGESEIDGKENKDPEVKPRHQSLPSNDLPLSPLSPTKVDHQKLLEQFVKRYSPQRLPVDWKLPPTKPRVVASVPKSTSSANDTMKKVESPESPKPEDDDVFEKKESSITSETVEEKTEEPTSPAEVVLNWPEIAKEETESKSDDVSKQNDSKVSLSEEEQNDRVPELSVIQRQISRELPTKKPVVDQPDISIPALIEKITKEGELLEHQKNPKKVKRKRSFLDKLLGRKKDIKK